MNCDHLPTGSLELRVHGRMSELGYEPLPASEPTHLLLDVSDMRCG